MNWKPQVLISKSSTPLIYLDTNILIELSKYEDGKCDNCYTQELGQLFELLCSLMQAKKIVCVLGNQMEEMGRTPGRENARSFLYNFTNAVLLEPSQIQDIQYDIGYSTYKSNGTDMCFNAKDIFEKVCTCSNSSIEIHIPTISKPEKAKKLKEDKKSLATKLNEMKESRQVAKNLENQLANELNGDFQAFQSILEIACKSCDSYMQYYGYIERIYRRMGVNPINSSFEMRKNAMESYRRFLLSEFHHALPFVWIQSVLFAHLMQRSKKVIPSDILDFIWASAYLPFVDYAVTDNSFCDLINESGLSEKYNVKTYSMKTLNLLLSELSKL